MMLRTGINTKAGSILLAMLLLAFNAFGQSAKCGFDKVIHRVIQNSPAFADSFDRIINNESGSRTSAKNTASITPVVPVVFHVVLTQSQLNSIGGEAGVRQRIDSQILMLNSDFNAENWDSVMIPGGFRQLYGNAGIRFGLAHTAPDGSGSEGYELKIAEKSGFNLDGGFGSGYGFSTLKYEEGGGQDIWDPQSYLNVWVGNLQEDGSTTNILGLAIPHYLTGAGTGISSREIGIVLNYAAFGKRSGLFDYYVPGSDMGRTLTHEVGHFFELVHIWGDDDGKCPHNGGADDGIADTPPQAYSSSGCPLYPKYDACTRTGDDGIMFMNFMDYTEDRCALMFTHGQAERMQAASTQGSRAYGLTQQPWLLEYPTVSANFNQFSVYPNPADGFVSIVFRNQPVGLSSIVLMDVAGRVVNAIEPEEQTSFYSFDLNSISAGIYFVVLDFTSGREVRRVVVR